MHESVTLVLVAVIRVVVLGSESGRCFCLTPTIALARAARVEIDGYFE
jgi:hypothetical protein